VLALAIQVTGVSCLASPLGESGGNGDSAEDIETIQAALTADDLHPSKPFRNSVVRSVLPTGTTLPDAVPGSPDVAPDGSARYTIPIEVPDGIEGMQPVMSIDYHGRRGPGLLGPGWNISGLSAIVRCRRNVAQDGSQYIAANESGVPRFLADNTFCLDGMRLIHKINTPAQMLVDS
jgi:hypothetical protein